MPSITQHEIESAKAKVGATSIDRARWLLKFPSLQSNDRSVRLEVVIFMGGTENQDFRLPSSQQVSEWQSTLRSALIRIGQGKSWYVGLKGRLGIKGGGRLIQEDSITQPERQDHWPFSFHAINAIIKGTPFLRICSNCKNPFLRNKRQEYCTSRCRSAFTKRRYRRSLIVQE